MLCPPLALGFSIAGLCCDDRKLCAIVTLLISGAISLFFLFSCGVLAL